jgi:hypothetical protein
MPIAFPSIGETSALARFDGTVLHALRQQRLATGGTAFSLKRLDLERTLATTQGALAVSDAPLASASDRVRIRIRIRIFLVLGGGWEDAAPPCAGGATANRH